MTQRLAPVSLDVGEHALERPDQFRPGRTQLLAMMQGEFPKRLFTLRRQFQQDLTTIFAVALAANQSFGREPVGQFNGTVMLNLEPLGYFSDGGGVVVRKALYGKHQLILLWIQTILNAQSVRLRAGSGGSDNEILQ